MPTGYDDGPAPLRRAGSAAGRQTASPKSWPAPSKDRKSTRLNSSHSQISYAVFCLKKNIQIHDTVTCARRDVARHQITVLRIPLFQEVEVIRIRTISWMAIFLPTPMHPQSTAFATR